MWWLNVFFLISGEWIAGERMSPPGWSPRAFPSQVECMERKRYAETQCRDYPLNHPALWICSKDKPLEQPPQEARARPCPQRTVFESER